MTNIKKRPTTKRIANKKKIKNKFLKGLKFVAKWTYKICVAATGSMTLVGGIATYNFPAMAAGASLIASTISSITKDGSSKGGKLAKLGNLGMKIINNLGQNDGYAKNDPKINK